jgi:ABC-type glycerol-3-phosphate transport system permease component
MTRSLDEAAMITAAIFAMSFLSLILVFIAFVTLQKYSIEGISTEGLKI